MTQSISGLVSGLDTSSIISQLVQIEQQRVTLITNREATVNTQLSTWQTITDPLTALKSAIQGLTHTTDWNTLTATSSDESAVKVTAGSGTLNGSLEFSVDRVASAGSFRSANTIGSTTQPIAADAAIFVAAKGGALGFSTFKSDNALTVGSHTITVTQASAAASKVGNSALGATTTINNGDTINLTVNGQAYTLDNIAAGSYNAADLAAAIQTAADAKGAAVNVTVDTATNALKIATKREGSAATLNVSGGTALAALNMTADAADNVGTDGKVQVDSAAEQVFTSIDAGQSLTLNAATGTINAVLSGGLRTGTVTGNNVSTGDGSLATVVANINSAGAGVTATAVQVGTGAYRLQLTSNTTGALNGANIDASEFNASVGSLVTLSAAQDAQITVGSGPGAYTVTSASNTVSGVMPGATLQLLSKTTDPVTVTVSRDAAGLAADVQAVVDAANKVHDAIVAATKYDADKKVASPLTGDSTASRVLNDLTRALIDATPWANPGAPGLLGVSVDQTGKFTFDSSKFTTAFNADPNGVIRAFTQGGTATNTGVSFVSAGDRAKAGTYAVNVTALATQADSVGLTGSSWPLASDQAIKVRVGTTELSYTIKAGTTLADAVNELNTRFGQQGFQLTASASGGGIDIKSSQYGTAARFDVAWDGVNYTTITGTDVTGTINGKAATGTGQQLSVPFDDPDVGGLALNITSTTTGDLGTFTYSPGIAQRVSTMISMATDSIDGYITSTQSSLKDNIKQLDQDARDMQTHVDSYEANLKAQFATLETTLSSLKGQSSSLTSAIAGLQAQTSSS